MNVEVEEGEQDTKDICTHHNNKHIMRTACVCACCVCMLCTPCKFISPHSPNLGGVDVAAASFQI